MHMHLQTSKEDKERRTVAVAPFAIDVELLAAGYLIVNAILNSIGLFFFILFSKFVSFIFLLLLGCGCGCYLWMWMSDVWFFF